MPLRALVAVIVTTVVMLVRGVGGYGFGSAIRPVL